MPNVGRAGSGEEIAIVGHTRVTLGKSATGIIHDDVAVWLPCSWEDVILVP
jgi:hypothetical protein